VVHDIHKVIVIIRINFFFSAGGTQEEIFFGFMPEMCVCVLICDSLEDEDVLVIRGARRVSNYVGYGLDVKVQGTLIPLCDSKPRCGHLTYTAA